VLLLVRHGESEANAAGLLAGRRDWPLTARGEAQARAVGLAVGPVTRIVSSPLTRARATATIVAAQCRVGAVDVDDRWLELDYGELDGTPVAEVPAPLWQAWQATTAFCPPGGESLDALGRRVRAACDELAVSDHRVAAADEHVAVVSHVSPIKAAVAWALGVDDAVSWRLHLAPASVTVVAVRSGRPVLVGYGLRPGEPSLA
jgi:probable phosphoglycerate mutase